MSKLIFTTSWDDGHKLDEKLADLLSRYKIKGTFYVPKNISNRLTDQKITAIAKLGHEIGAHTVNHVKLTKMDLTEVKNEINDSKKWLDGLIGKSTKMFCYPYGEYNQIIADLVKEAGFVGARTIEKRKIDLNWDSFQMPVALQVYPFPLRKLDAKRFYYSKYLFRPLSDNYSTIKQNKLSWRSLLSWNKFSAAYFSSVFKNSGYFHLWGHSWEIEKYDMWQNLEKFLRLVSSHQSIVFLTNAETVSYAHHDSD